MGKPYLDKGDLSNEDLTITKPGFDSLQRTRNEPLYIVNAGKCAVQGVPVNYTLIPKKILSKLEEEEKIGWSAIAVTQDRSQKERTKGGLTSHSSSDLGRRFFSYSLSCALQLSLYFAEMMLPLMICGSLADTGIPFDNNDTSVSSPANQTLKNL